MCRLVTLRMLIRPFMSEQLWLGVREPACLHVCVWVNKCASALGVRVCAPGAVAAAAVRVARVPHVLALALSVCGGQDCCDAAATAATDWARPGRVAVRANVLTNNDAVLEGGLLRTPARTWRVTPQGRVTWTATGVVLELCAVTWCGEPVRVRPEQPAVQPAVQLHAREHTFPTLLWDDTVIAQHTGWSLLSLYRKHWSPAVVAAAVQKCGLVLGFVPTRLRTPTLCASAVRQDGLALNKVPEALRTPELCAAAVQQNGMALNDVPEALRTAALCAAAVQQNGMALSAVPVALRTPELCTAAVQHDGAALHHVPADQCAAAVYLAAVRQDANALQHVPFDRRTCDLCITAVEAKEFTQFHCIPVECHTPALLWAVLKRQVTHCTSYDWEAVRLPEAEVLEAP